MTFLNEGLKKRTLPNFWLTFLRFFSFMGGVCVENLQYYSNVIIISAQKYSLTTHVIDKTKFYRLCWSECFPEFLLNLEYIYSCHQSYKYTFLLWDFFSSVIQHRSCWFMWVFKILFSFLGLNLLEYFSVSKEKHQSRDRSAGEIPFTIVMHQ